MLLGAWIGGSLAAQTTKLTADRLFDPNHLPKIELELAESDWESLRAQTRTFGGSMGKTPAKRPYTYFKGNVTIDGLRIANVGIRKKGFLGSLDRRRPSLKIKFEHYQDQSPIAGIDRLTLNNAKQDRSLLSQFLSQKIFREAGVVASRCNHVHVLVNGVSLGIYANLESIKAPFLRREFGDDSGDLFEGTVADVFPDTLAKFERKSRRTKIEPLRELAASLAKKPLDLAALERVLDVDAFLTFWAVESLIGLWDGYTNNQNNYFVYRRPSNDKLYFLPWGTDSAFTSRMPIPPFVIRTRSVHSQAVLPNLLYGIPAIQKRYRSTLERVMTELWDEKALLAEMKRVRTLVDGHLHESQRDLTRQMRAVRTFIRNRRKVLQRELDRWPLQLPSGPRRPVYFRPVGKASGKFSTTWSAQPPANALDNGSARISLVLDGERVEFANVGIASHRSTWPTGDGSTPPPSIVFTGKRASNGKSLVLAFSPDAEDFHATDSARVVVQGVVIEDNKWMDFESYRMVTGHATFERAATKAGAPVRGEFAVEIVRMAGGKPVQRESK